jgi:hypothetical protein
MPTERPRLTITLTPEIDRALTAFTEGTGQSRSSFILHVLQESLPALERLALAMQAVKKAKPEALAGLRGDADRMIAMLQGMTELAGGSLDLFAARAGAGAKAPPSRSAGGASRKDRGTANPPPPNRGGSSPSRGGKVVRLNPRGGTRAR